MKTVNNDIKRPLVILLAVSFLLRLFAAAFVEFGNDEVYYWTYALYPDLSHFDHPPMVGFFIQLFSLDLLFDSELFIRLSSVVLMTLDTYLIYLIGKEAKDDVTGLYAAMLYTGSIYAFVITGIFIMPDTPLSVFWLLSTIFAIRWLRNDNPDKKHILLTGLFTGLAFLSKYTGVFIWVGIGIYILFFDRKKLKDKWLYASILITVTLTMPVVFWNFKNDFASFGFHSDRISIFGKPDLTHLGTEIGGEILYNNPINFVLSIIALVMFFKGKLGGSDVVKRLVVSTALPLILTFWFFALTRPTLPHWKSPAFNQTFVLIAIMLNKGTDKQLLPKPIIASVALMAMVLILGIAEIKTGFIPLDKHTETEKSGRDDFTLDMYGWEKLGKEFAKTREKAITKGEMTADCGLVSHKWFPLANLDYYVARPLEMKAYGLGNMEDIHKYYWINDERGGLESGANYWYITDSHYYNDPFMVFEGYFEEITLVDTISIERCGKPCKNNFVYTCKGLKKLPQNANNK